LRLARAVLALLLANGLATCGARADPPPPEWLTGDWGGLRTRLLEHGLSFQISHVTETAYNASGGSRNVIDYTDQVAAGVTFDLQRLVGLHDARIQVTYTERAGRNLVDDAQLGTLMLVQEVYGRGQTVRLTELWFEQAYFDKHLSWKWGRMPVGGDFAAFSCDFQNLITCGSQPGNLVSNYIYNWPISQWGTRLKLNLDGFGYVQAGVFDQNTQYLGFDNKLWPVFYAGSTGVLVPLEIAWLPALDGGRLPGSYKIGGWYSTSSLNDLTLDINGGIAASTGLSPATHQGLYGGYVSFQQQVTRNASVDPSGGLRLFFNAVIADTATSFTDRQMTVGAWYTGPFESRPHDAIAFAAGLTHVNSRAADVVAGTAPARNSEYVLELDYTVVPVQGVRLRPNVQYVINPGGVSASANIWIFGLKTVLNF